MYTQYSLPSDGTTGPFPISFNYLDGSTISVTRYDLDGVSNPLPLTFTFAGTVSDDKPSGSSINLSEAVASGYILTVAKTIDMDTPALVWNQGAEITQKNLRKTTRNLMEMAQTAHDLGSKALASVLDTKEISDALALLVPANLTSAAADVLANKNAALAAKVAAETAETNAETALSSLITRMQGKITLDFGEGTAEKVFTVTIAGLTVGMVIRVDHIALAVAGRDVDEAEMDCIVCTAYVSATNTLTIYAQSITGPVHGQYNFAITY